MNESMPSIAIFRSPTTAPLESTDDERRTRPETFRAIKRRAPHAWLGLARARRRHNATQHVLFARRHEPKRIV